MAEPPDQVVLLRVIWWDRDYDQDELIASKVFPSDDLKSPRYISVDRNDLLSEAELRERLASQRLRSEEKGDYTRKEPRHGLLPCWEVRSLRYDANSSPYLKVWDASEGFYDSHCAIENVNTNPGRPSYNEIRRQLMEILKRHGVVNALVSP
jgi:hypothetical protein